MDVANTIFLFMGALLLAALMQPLSAIIRLPFSLMLIFAGFLGAEAVIAFGVDTGLRWQHFNIIVFYIFLPALIFESALHLNTGSLVKKLIPILILSTPMLVLATLISAALIYWGIGYPEHFPWMAALLTGVLLSATDPAAVINLFKQVGVSEQIILLIEGESLFNDAVAILLFGLFSSLVLMPGEIFSLSYAVERFVLVFVGGILVGGLVLICLLPLFLIIKDNFSRMIIMICSAYGSFLMAESVFHASGVMAVLIAGLGFGMVLQQQTVKIQDSLKVLWQFNAQFAEALLFLLLGITITWGMFEQQWLAMLLGIAAVLVARAGGLLLTLPVINCIPGTKVSWKEGIILYWGGVRGAVTVALALSLPLQLESWFTIQSIAYGVVLFSIGIQAATTPLLIKIMQLKDKEHEMP